MIRQRSHRVGIGGLMALVAIFALIFLRLRPTDPNTAIAEAMVYLKREHNDLLSHHGVTKLSACDCSAEFLEARAESVRGPISLPGRNSPGSVIRVASHGSATVRIEVLPDELGAWGGISPVSAMGYDENLAWARDPHALKFNCETLSRWPPA